MTNRQKNLIIFIIALVLAAGVYAWFYPLNTGNVSVTTGGSHYVITSGEKGLECKTDPCTLTLNSGIHEIKIQKDGFFPETRTVRIQRGQTEAVTIELTKIPNIKVSPIVPADQIETVKDLPGDLKALSLLSPAWSPTGRQLAFIDQNDNKLKKWESDQISIIVSLAGLTDKFEMEWSPDEKWIIGYENRDIYFIDIKKTARKKIISEFSLQKAVWSLNSDYLLVNDIEKNLYQIDFSKKTLTPLNRTIDLNQAVWESADRLILYSYFSEENRTVIESFDLKTLETQEILTRYNFPIQKITSDGSDNIYFYRPDDQTWYLLDY